MSPTTFWGGIKVARLGVLLGVMVLAGAGPAWFFPQLRWLLLAHELEAATERMVFHVKQLGKCFT